MSLLQQINEEVKVPFTTSTTHMPSYDDMMKKPDYFREAKKKKFKIVQMSPEEYLDKVADGFSVYGGYDRAAALNVTQKLVDEYAEKMEKGEKFPMVVLDHTSARGFDGKKEKAFTQEGRHRAFAAKKIGVKKIPVMVVDDAE